MEIVKRKGCFVPYKNGVGETRVFLSLRSKTAQQYPDCYSFWGGEIKPGETPEQTMIRETQEELRFIPHDYSYFGIHHDSMPNEKHIFYAKVDENFESRITIQESQGGRWFSWTEIEAEKKMIKEDKKILCGLFELLKSLNL